MPQAESEARRRTERTAKTRIDGVLGGVEAEIAREAGVGASDRLARLEQGAGGVEEYSADQEMRSVTEFRLSRAAAPAFGGRIAARPPEDVAQYSACGEINFGRLGVRRGRRDLLVV